MRRLPQYDHVDLGLVDDDQTEDLRRAAPVVPGVPAPGGSRRTPTPNGMKRTAMTIPPGTYDIDDPDGAARYDLDCAFDHLDTAKYYVRDAAGYLEGARRTRVADLADQIACALADLDRLREVTGG
jgi:hypothetical protein